MSHTAERSWAPTESPRGVGCSAPRDVVRARGGAVHPHRRAERVRRAKALRLRPAPVQVSLPAELARAGAGSSARSGTERSGARTFGAKSSP